MKRKGSVTVVFSMVFLLLLSFILSFFEMAAYTARMSYHASAALLAVENYFAAYLKPLYRQYHIFGREAPEGEEILSWTEKSIAEDVAYMTQKREGEKSLLLRSGAAFSVASATVLTEQNLDGFYLQAASAMKYRGVLEISELLKQFMGMAEQADAQLTAAAAKSAVDTAYAQVEEKLLKLMEQIDGVDFSRYERFFRGRTSAFQKDAYVKYFCTDVQNAAQYFDRTEVYQAFLHNSENPCEVLEHLLGETEELTRQLKEREENEAACGRRLEEIAAEQSLATQTEGQLCADKEAANEQLVPVQAQIAEVMELLPEETSGEVMAQLATLLAEKKQILSEIERMTEEEEALKKRQKELSDEKREQEKLLVGLKKQKREQDAQIKKLSKEEERFLKKCAGIARKCEEAYREVSEIRRELNEAKKIKSGCERLLNSMQGVLGEESVKKYREELDKYRFYESAEGYDFEQIQSTLAWDAGILYGIKKALTPPAADSGTLEEALTVLQKEKTAFEGYSFEGLKLNYGEMSLGKDLSGQAEDSLMRAAGEGFLGFLTEKEISGKKLEVSYLPSGFRYEGRASANVFSMLGSNITDMLEELRELLPSGNMPEMALNAVLFHSYLMTHFSDYLEENREGALSYELEYLIAGKAADMDNLFSVVMQLCMLRAVLHFISLYTDSARKSMAEQAALAACGIIGLPALKSIITFLLLFIWAVEEAVIDVAALLQGKKLALYPGKNGGSLTFPELFLFSRKLTAEKAKGKKEAGGPGFGYREYLQVFLLLLPKDVKSYRSLDLIQENLRKGYDASFRVSRCVWKVSYRTDQRDYEYAYEN